MKEMDENIVKEKLNLMNWDILDDEDLINDQKIVAVWKDKIIEIMSDNSVNLIDLYGRKTKKKDQFGDLIFEDKIVNFKFKKWEDMRDRLVLNDFITAPTKDFIKAKRERQIFYLFFIEGLDKRYISSLLKIDNINLNSIIYRLRKRLEGLRTINEIITKAPSDKISSFKRSMAFA